MAVNCSLAFVRHNLWQLKKHEQHLVGYFHIRICLHRGWCERLLEVVDHMAGLLDRELLRSGQSVLQLQFAGKGQAGLTGDGVYGFDFGGVVAGRL